MDKFEFLENKISLLIHAAIKERAFSGCSVAISQGNKELCKNFGLLSWQDSEPVCDDTFFDLASLTKPLATSLVVFSLISRGKIDLGDKLGALLGMEVPEDKEEITLFQLLNHCSGLPAHRHFYKILEKIPAKERKQELLRLILAEPLESAPGSLDIYSDLGFMVLGLLSERQSGKDLDEALATFVYEPMGLADKLIFKPKEKGIMNFAATEQCPWRRKLIKGEVDDQNTWVVGGVSGQSGLFGRAKDVLSMLRMIVEIGRAEKKHPYLTHDLLTKAMQRQGGIKASSWGLGFDTPSDSGSSAGSFISRRSCGHLGFTGTSFWHDFDKDISVVLLTNRIHPTVDNDRIKTFRPQFHDLVFQCLL